MYISQTLKLCAARMLRDERGEVTIAWVVITGAIIGLSVTLLTQIGDGTQQLSGKVGDEMSEQDVVTSF